MHGMESLSIPARRSRPALLGSRRLLALAGDERLVEQIRRGNEAAFEVVFERYGAPILGFCRHLLGSREEAEDAVQHAFAAAHRQLLRDERPIELKPWLYAIARNRCLSLLRARRAEPAPLDGLATDGLSEQVERRANLRELLRDVAELPFEQRAALLLAELGDLSHAQIATVLECEEARVKALVYRARSGLIARRDARALPCGQVREQLATLRGGALRRLELKHHLRACPGCREYRAEVKRQRRLLGAALPVAPSLGLKASVLGAIGLGGGSAGGGGGALIAGIEAALSSLGGATAAKTAVVVIAATGAAVGGGTAVERVVDAGGSPAAVSPSAQQQAALGAAGSAGAHAQIERSATALATPARPAAGPGGSGRHEPPGLAKRDTTAATAAIPAGRGRADGLARGRSGQAAQPGVGGAKRLGEPPGQAKAKSGGAKATPGEIGAKPGGAGGAKAKRDRTTLGRDVAKATPVERGRSAKPAPRRPAREAQDDAKSSPQTSGRSQPPTAAPGRSGSAPGQPHDVPAQP